MAGNRILNSQIDYNGAGPYIPRFEIRKQYFSSYRFPIFNESILIYEEFFLINLAICRFSLWYKMANNSLIGVVLRVMQQTKIININR